MPEKQSINVSYGQKLINLFARLLFTGEQHSLTDLSRELGCSKQTVLRLLDDIQRGFKGEIEVTKQGNRHFYRIQKTDPTPHLPISRMEVNVLYMCRAFAEHLLGKTQFEDATRAFLKSHALLPQEENGGQQYFACFRPGSIDYTPHQETLQALLAAMEEKKICKITYQPIGEGKDKNFYIKPLKIFSHLDTIYLHARMARTPGKKYIDPAFDPLLAMHRIKAIDKTERPYRLPKDYDFEKTFNREFGIIKEKAFEVEAEFTGWAAGYISERVWSPHQKIVKKGKGKIILTFASSSQAEVMSWILSFGEEARLLKPEWLVKQVKDRIEKMQKTYST
ncbi:MAG: WYL domain-containing protein [Deltaproteobacteria bacterium]|nr:WYL domain-containing protein [Deltaproteobacteria bacterium]